MASRRDLAWLTIIGVAMIAIGYYGSILGSLQGLVVAVGMLLLVLGVFGLLDVVLWHHA